MFDKNSPTTTTMTKQKRYIAVIPVRAGSRRLPNKNIAPFAGSNLLINKIRQLKRVPKIDEIVVTSDSDEMLQMARDEGVTAHWREKKYCDESVPFGELVRYLCNQFLSENIIWAHCTAPLVGPDLFLSAIEKFEKNVLQEGKFDSLMSVESFKKHVWTESGPVNYEAAGLRHTLSQNLPTFYFITWGIFISPREKMVEWAYPHGPNPYKFVLSKCESVDIDDALDLACARAWSDMFP
jgi:N-acylneuraminate cytidylyltransferase